MSPSHKALRESVGFTFLKAQNEPILWIERARQFNQISILINNQVQHQLNPAFHYNAGLSLELALKAIIISKSKSFEHIHKLNDLLKIAEIKVNIDQECTLELLSEIILWIGRYPTPTREGYWDNFYDNIFEKHIIRRQVGNTFKTIKNEARYPTFENCQKLWKIFEDEFLRLRNP